MSRPLTWLDVFTSTPLEGNGLAVVHDADGLDDATMLAFARETGLSETTFVQSPTAPGAAYRNRIWTVGWETAFAGHPSLGTAVAEARRRGERQARYVQETRAGLQPVEVEVELGAGGAAHASMLQNAPEHGSLVDPARVLAAAGLAPGVRGGADRPARASRRPGHRRGPPVPHRLRDGPRRPRPGERRRGHRDDRRRRSVGATPSSPPEAPPMRVSTQLGTVVGEPPEPTSACHGGRYGRTRGTPARVSLAGVPRPSPAPGLDSAPTGP